MTEDLVNKVTPNVRSNTEAPTVNTSEKAPMEFSLFFDNKETEASRQQKMGAEYANECEVVLSKINSILDHVPEERKTKTQDFLESVERADLGLEEKRNILRYGACQFIFGLENTKHPEVLKPKIDKLMKSTRYDPSFKDDLALLSTHIDGVLEQYKQSVERQQVASDFGLLNNNNDISKSSYDHLLSEFFKGNITEDEFLKYSDSDKSKYRKGALLKQARDKKGWDVVKQYKDMSSYFPDGQMNF